MTGQAPIGVLPHLAPQRPTITDALGRLPLVGRFVPSSNDPYTFTTFRLTVPSSPGDVCAMVHRAAVRPSLRTGPIHCCAEAVLCAATP